jgi:histidinol-phosphate aminotransferase
MANAITERTKLVYLANPNNPTGTCFGKTEWEDFIQKVPKHVIVVLDEAYTEYVTDPDYADGLDYLDAYPNLLVSRTFSKAYGLAALRVGYMVGHPEVIGYINRIREPFNINHLAQVAAQTALTDQAFVRKTVELNQQGMVSLMRFFDDMDLEYIPSQGNFICVRLGESAPQVNQALLAEGVIVRPVAKQDTFAEFLRVSIGLQKENSHFMDALRKILSRSA